MINPEELEKDLRHRESSRATVRRYFEEIWNRHQTQSIAELMTDEHRIQIGVEHFDGLAEFRDLVALWTDAFPDMCLYLEDLVAEGQQVAVRWAARGTHRGPFVGIAPTGKEVNFWGVSILMLKDGRVARQWVVLDWEELMAALTGRKAYCLNPFVRHAA